MAGLAADPELRAGRSLSGAGERAFVGGADINELAALDRDSARDFITLVHRCCDAFRRLPVPVIARIDGYALGAGLELAAACDLRVASERSHFGMPEVRIGIPSVVEAALLPRLIGAGRARRLLLTGETIDAADRARLGPGRCGRAARRARRRGRALCRGDPRRRPAGDPPAEGADPRLGGAASTSAAVAARHRLLRRGLRHRRAAAHGRRRGSPRCGRAERARLMPAKARRDAATASPTAPARRRIFSATAQRLRQRLIAGGAGQPARLRTARSAAVRRQPARRREAAGQGSDRPLRQLCRGAERRSPTICSPCRGWATPASRRSNRCARRRCG